MGPLVSGLLILLAGIMLLRHAYNLRYHTFVLDDLVVDFWLLLGIPVWVWSILHIGLAAWQWITGKSKNTCFPPTGKNGRWESYL